jgi:transposase
MSSSQTLRLEIEKLKAKLVDRDAVIADRDAVIADRDRKIEKLASDLNELKVYVNHMLAGRRSTTHDHGSQGLHFGAPESAELDAEDEAAVSDDDGNENGNADAADAADVDRDSKPTNTRGPKLTDTSGLPCEERIHELPEEERICPITGERFVPVGEETFKEIKYRRAKLLVIIHKKIVYGPAPDVAEERKVTTVTAAMPPRALEDCAASTMLLAWLLVQKYANHLPLYRQQAIFARDGLRIARQTLCDWVLAAAAALEPIVACLMTKIRAGPVMQLDDTPVMCHGGKGAKHFQAYLWTFVNPEVSGGVNRFTEGRGSELLAHELEGFAGTLVGDGYSGNRAAANKVTGEIKLAGCYAHVTRKFREVTDAPGSAKLFCADIKRLYAIKQEADEAKLSPEARRKLRKKKSRSVLASLLARARRLRGSFNESGGMAKALGYFLKQRKPLRRFLEDGRIPLDNNSCERSIRPIAIGRRNWLFAGSPRGRRSAAVVYSLLESCKIEGIDPIRCIEDVLVRVATHPANRIEDLLPSRWYATIANDRLSDQAHGPELALAT